MPRIFDNIEKELLPALQETIKLSDRADFCVGYFNLRGWRQIDSFIERWSGEDGSCCRLLVGMQRAVEQDLRQWLGLTSRDEGLDNQSALKFKKQLAVEFRQQLTLVIPTDEDEAGLRRLAAQIRAKKVRVKLYLRHPLHAKLYLLFRPDPINPIVAYLGSSNLTLSGLSKQGELNVDVLEVDAGEKLKKWFEDRWNDRWCIDISTELAEIIESSWARLDLVQPHHIYLNIAYHLSREARRGLAEFKIPREFGVTLFEFQTAAVRIAAHHLNKRGGVLIGEVTGSGVTLDEMKLDVLAKRNRDRFPDDFMFQLTTGEFGNLRYQSGISNELSRGHGERRYPPYAFTEEGVAMLFSVLRSERAIHVNIEILCAVSGAQRRKYLITILSGAKWDTSSASVMQRPWMVADNPEGVLKCKYRAFSVQMKGRGVRIMKADDLQSVTPDAKGKKQSSCSVQPVRMGIATYNIRNRSHAA